MRPEALALLEDIRAAAERIVGFAAARSAHELETDILLRSAVERQFEIVGEAMNRLLKLDAGTATNIPDHRAIIAFRNRLIHGYNEIDYEVVWEAIQASLPNLLATVKELLAQEDT
jgi:uncharacterized protein with HEPN domain